MKLTLAIATVNPALLCRCLGQALRTAEGDFDVCIYGNGVEIDMGLLACNSVYTRTDPNAELNPWDLAGGRARNVRIAWDRKNRGVPYALHRLYEMAEMGDDRPTNEHVVLYLHDDVFIHEHGWDLRLLRAFEDPKVDLAGFLGAIGLGFEAIYKIPYESHHVSRYGGMSNLVNAQAHGERVFENRPAAFVDGLAMAIRMRALDVLKGWSWWPTAVPHYAYDYGMSCMIRRHGGRCVLVPVACQHGVETNGGLASGTTVLEPHRATMERFGGDQAVYQAAQKWVYEEFRDVLPLRLSEDEFHTFACRLVNLNQDQLRRAFNFLTGEDRRRAATVLLANGMEPTRVQRVVNA